MINNAILEGYLKSIEDYEKLIIAKLKEEAKENRFLIEITHFVRSSN